MRRGLFYLTTRIVLLILLSTLLSGIIVGSIPLLITTILIASIAIYIVNGYPITISYLYGLIFILFIQILVARIYLLTQYQLSYIYYYTIFVCFATTITTQEILELMKTNLFKPILYLLIVMRLQSIFINDFHRSMEIHRAIFRNRWKTQLYALTSLFNNLPFMVFKLSEYLYTHLKTWRISQQTYTTPQYAENNNHI